ncbi:hypothetical protein [Archangium violaceum]|uniref:Uncharacterized protein n=1 Tax=Archangium violaceum Cb vi76 TaxID=1406225 RepID=A0A084SSN1_9BACT|nr:hypothetical protein [Archangium violaceum]KFA91466.1 hypothetical protein Q664_21900 [Archangium violaceum Cb vi76]
MSQSRSIDATLNLAQSLSEDFAHRSKADQAEAIRELKQIIASAPERSEFSDTKKFVYTMPLSGAVLLVLAIYIMRTQTSPSWGVIAGMLGLVLFSLVLAYQHRNDGATPHMVLTRTELQVSNLSAPLPLVEVTGLEIVEPSQTWINFHVGENTRLPTAKKVRGLLMSQAVVFPKSKPRRIAVSMVGIKVNGKKLDWDETMELLERHLQAAHATAELQALRAR